MDPLLETLLWFLLLLPLTLIAAGFILYLLIQRWQAKTKEDLKEIRSSLRGYQTESARLRLQGEAYTPDDPAPFGPLAANMLTSLKDADQQVSQLYKDYAYGQESSRRLDPAQLRQKKDPSSWVRYPYEWYSLRHYVVSLKKDLEHPSTHLQDALAVQTRMQSQGWEVARLARQVLEDAENSLRILTQLRAENLRDPILESAVQESQECEQILRSQLPVYFLSGDEKSVTTQADKDTITGVYRIVDGVRLSVHDTLKKALSWERQHKALEKSLDDLADQFRPLGDRIAALEAAAIHPINWDVSRGQLSSLRQQIEHLARPNQVRKIEQMEKDLAAANQLLSALNVLNTHTEKMAGTHQALIEIVEHPDLKQGQEWSRQAKRVAEQAAAYDPENWPRAAGLPHLGEDLKALAEHHERLDIKNTTVPVTESELEIALEEARQLARLHQDLRPRLASIQERLVEVQETERNTRDLLARTRALLNQALPLISSNTPLAGEAASQAESLRAEAETMTDEVEQRGRGVIDKKAQSASALGRKAEQAGNQWLETLEESLAGVKQTLHEKVGTLRSIAFLDEPAVIEAEQLISGHVEEAPEGRRGSLLSGLPFLPEKGGARRRQREQIPFAEVVKELKQKNDQWQRCVAVSRAIEDIEGPILEEYSRAEKHAISARDVLSQALQIVPTERGWPPTTQHIQNEQRALDSLERRWEALKNERLRALQLISKLSELASSFQELEGKIVQIAERAGQEQDRVIDLEQRLGESMRMWQYQMQAYGSNLYLKDEVQLLLQETDAELGGVKQRYLSGALPYNQVLQSMRTLCQRVESAQATLDADQVIDINGVVQRRGY
jgi:hypothetical protein